MVVRTRHTTYILVDIGNGAYLISGHPRYCPHPIRGQLSGEPIVGQDMFFNTVAHPEVIRTTTILEIKE